MGRIREMGRERKIDRAARARDKIRKICYSFSYRCTYEVVFRQVYLFVHPISGGNREYNNMSARIKFHTFVNIMSETNIRNNCIKAIIIKRSTNIIVATLTISVSLK